MKKIIYVGDKAGAEAYIKEGVTEVIDHTGKGMQGNSVWTASAAASRWANTRTSSLSTRMYSIRLKW